MLATPQSHLSRLAQMCMFACVHAVVQRRQTQHSVLLDASLSHQQLAAQPDLDSQILQPAGSNSLGILGNNVLCKAQHTRSHHARMHDL